MPTINFAQNLRWLCGYYPSIAEICRQLGINRQQFNKYMSGVTMPKYGTLRRICDFFGLDEVEIVLPLEELKAIVAVRQKPDLSTSPMLTHLAGFLDFYSEQNSELERYCGYYFYCQRSPNYPGMILRSLVVVFEEEGCVYSKTIERLPSKQSKTRTKYISKYHGILTYASDRIYLLEDTHNAHQSISLNILYPNHRSHLEVLTGVGLAVTGGASRKPFATNIAMEYLGKSMDVRKALRGCGVFEEDSPDIPDDILAVFVNKDESDIGILLAAEP